jgi:outer membrane immunogenic protein
MKKILILAAALAISAPLTAFAADLPQPPAPAPVFVPPQPFTWTGVYIGVNGGYSLGNANLNDGFGDSASFNANGGIVGGTLGFNYQSNWGVAGFEADFDWAGNQSNQSSFAPVGLASAFPLAGIATSSGASLVYKDDVLSTFAMRFGAAADHWLFYGKAGAAWMQEKVSVSGTDPILGTISGSNSFDRVGWMVGVGVEYAITNNLTAKAEYNYIDFGSNNETLSANTSNFGPANLVITSKPTMSVAKFGLNWLFNGT